MHARHHQIGRSITFQLRAMMNNQLYGQSRHTTTGSSMSTNGQSRGQNIPEVRIKELISSLSNEERQMLYHHLRMIMYKERYEREYAAAQKQHPSKLRTWFAKGTSRITKYIEKPTRSQLSSLFIYHSLPYVAFGFLDNCIMIMSGDYIMATIGGHFGISTLASAGLGNALADAVSISLAYYVESFFSALVKNTPASSMTLSQFELRRTRWVIQSARVIGISFGCILGMAPLFIR
ncbi:hypothetical protein RDWZM_005636 [Blomia tropicalis]|uniref:Transmembrane protein 65 n=1 Tax=Blomia tropicalis TaxID=40697 RepID=A0A9Q0M6K8_BLOTA|nr:Transmembrane protein 65 [Blomia tropicalis]KAJ6219824.1 hypothetical protein RDWZM_005636 [Blomia tropicalis]